RTPSSPAGLTTHLIWGPTVRPDPRALGRRAGSGSRRLRDALDAQVEGDADLPAHEEPTRRAAAAGPLQAGVDCQVSRYRGRRRPRDLRANRNLIPETT